jgi:hypothetical protein
MPTAVAEVIAFAGGGFPYKLENPHDLKPGLR